MILSVIGMVVSLIYLISQHVTLHRKMDAMNGVLQAMNDDINKLAASKVVRTYNGKS